jgi:hypothetical protein
MIEKMEMILIEEELALVCGSFLLVLYWKFMNNITEHFIINQLSILTGSYHRDDTRPS